MTLAEYRVPVIAHLEMPWQVGCVYYTHIRFVHQILCNILKASRRYLTAAPYKVSLNFMTAAALVVVRRSCASIAGPC